MKLPPIPAKMRALDQDAIAVLAMSVCTTQGRKAANNLADYYEKAVEAHEHNLAAAREALRILREALGDDE